MFDCPEHSHTSPTNTSRSTVGSPSLRLTVYGPPALGVGNCAKNGLRPALPR